MISRYEQGARMSLAVAYGPFLETAGIAAEDTSQDVQGQLREVLATIDRLMAEAGVGKQHLTRVQIWIADYSHFDPINAVYDAWLDGHPKPVRACVGADLGEGYRVEVQVFAFRPSMR